MEEDLKRRVLGKVNKERVVGFVKDLVRIPSYTGEEMEVAEFAAGWLERRGLEVDLQECTPTRHHEKSANVVAILRGSGGGRDMMLNGHLDTDPACGEWKYDPWDPVIFELNGRRVMNGIGTTNMKGSDGCMVEAVLAIKDAGVELKGDVLVTLVCRELQGGWGIDKVLEKYTADVGINTEPHMLGMNPSPGISRVQVQVYGETAHIHEKERAVNATVKMARVIEALDGLDFPYTRRVAPPKQESLPIMAISCSRSGIGEDYYDGRPATIGDRATVKMDVRWDTNMTEEMVYKDMQDVLDRLEAEDPQLKTKLEPIPTYITRPSYELPRDHYIANVVKRAHKHVYGVDVEWEGPSIGGSDAAFMWTKKGIPTVIYGLMGHSQSNWNRHVDIPDLCVEVDDLPLLSKVLALSCLEACNTPKEKPK